MSCEEDNRYHELIIVQSLMKHSIHVLLQQNFENKNYTDINTLVDPPVAIPISG